MIDQNTHLYKSKIFCLLVVSLGTMAYLLGPLFLGLLHIEMAPSLTSIRSLFISLSI